MHLNKTNGSKHRWFDTFLSDGRLSEPWIAKTVLSAFFLGSFYVAIHVLALRWWMPMFAIIAVGVVWARAVSPKPVLSRVNVYRRHN